VAAAYLKESGSIPPDVLSELLRDQQRQRAAELASNAESARDAAGAPHMRVVIQTLRAESDRENSRGRSLRNRLSQ
jgi:hypothetical protein